MKRILVLATTTGYQTRAFGEAANALGVELAFATDRCEQIDDPWQDDALPIRFHEEDRAVATIIEEAQAHPFDGILAVGDRPTVIAARAAAALRIPWHPAEAASIARHKLRTRDRFRSAGLPTPWIISTTIDADLRLITPPSFPCVVKPASMSGSRGVMRADDRAGLVEAFRRLRGLLASASVRVERDAAHDTILIERFIPGREFAVEALMHHGRMHLLAIFDKPDPLDGPFFEETIYITPSQASAAEQRAVADGIARAAEAIGLRHGPIHAECRVNDYGVYVLEVAARPIGGLCTRVIQFDGHPFEEVLLRHALGEDPSGWRPEPGTSGVMMIPIPRRGVYRDVDGVRDAAAVAGVTEVRITAKPDQVLIPLPEGSSYLGFIFARGASPSDVDRALRDAHARLSFRIDVEFPVLKGTHIQ